MNRHPQARRLHADRPRRCAGRARDIQLGRRSQSGSAMAALAGAGRKPCFVRKSDKPDAIEQLSGAIARRPSLPASRFARRNSSRQRLGLHGGRARQGHARDLDRNLAGNRRGRIHPAERPRRRDPVAPRPRSREVEQPPNRTSPKRSSPTRISRSTRRWREGRKKVVIGKTATPSSRRASPRRSHCRASGTLSLALRSLADAAKRLLPNEKTRCGQARRNQHGALRHQHHVHAEMSL